MNHAAYFLVLVSSRLLAVPRQDMDLGVRRSSLPSASLPQMKGGAAMEIIDQRLSNAIMRAADWRGYQAGAGGVFALCDICSSGRMRDVFFIMFQR